MDICEEVVLALPPEKAHSFPRHYNWAARLLGGFIESEIHHAPDRNPDAALRVHATLTHLVRPPVKIGKYLKTLPLLYAAMALETRLRHEQCPPCDAKLFEKYLRILKIHHKSADVTAESARSGLYHPLTPSAWCFYERVSTGDPRISEDLLGRIRVEAKAKLAIDYMRAAYRLRLQGSEIEARYLEGIVKRNNVMWWQKRSKLLQKFTNDRRLSLVREGGSRDRVWSAWK